ncbi:pentapeptide repeat-containing protein [Actinomadura roseirufa]|uniref:pentapeptide repeat-containing protein n=1 Tax=Actinomadura roseirufa TaxID=2094049 RepID=UPI001041185E
MAACARRHLVRFRPWRPSQRFNRVGFFVVGPDLQVVHDDLEAVGVHQAGYAVARRPGADLRSADLRDTNLRDATLRNADPRGADLWGIKGLSATAVRAAAGVDEHTRF